MAMILDLSGRYEVRLKEGAARTQGEYGKRDSSERYEMSLPGTLDEGGIGTADTPANQWHPDQNLGKDEEHKTLLQDTSCIMTRFTRKHVYTGEASYTRRFSFDADLLKEGYRYFLKAERTRKCAAYLNGKSCPVHTPGTLSTPYLFEITDLLQPENELTFVVDNGYEGWPASDILYSSAATDETQTNWNGILGEIAILREKKAFLRDLRVYPLPERKVRLWAGVDEVRDDGAVSDKTPVSQIPVRVTCVYTPGKETEKRVILFDGVALAKRKNTCENGLDLELTLPSDLSEWDMGEGNLFTLTVEPQGMEPKSVTSGYRLFGSDGQGHFTLNNRRIFIRSEANCCVFPETGHMPLTVEEWLTVLRTYTSYGVNTMRFHSHFPPKAAFEAADKLGVLMMPELSCWNPEDAMETPERFSYYKLELEQILREYASRPSFVTLTFGNELHCNEAGVEHLKDLLKIAHHTDPTRLFADGSNNFYGARGFFTDPDPAKSSDFYTASDFKGRMMRGTSANMQGYINQDMQGTDHNFDELLDVMRLDSLQPVIPHEVGQFEVLPDFKEIDAFRGVTSPENLIRLKEIAKERGFLTDWEQRVAASGELALIAYREETEAALRSKDMAGISLLGLQDFPGQGTALVGMLNSHLQPKPYAFAKPERFAAFFNDCLPLFITDRLIYTCTETISAKVKVADYRKNPGDSRITVLLCEAASEVENTQKISKSEIISCIDLQEDQIFTLELPEKEEACAYTLTLKVQDTETGVEAGKNTYTIWVYPDRPLQDHDVVTCVSFDEAKKFFSEGRKVLYCPPATKESFPDSIGTHFTTDFWSVGTFAGQDGFMGIMTDVSHQIFRHFPTAFHADRQWWNLLYKGRAFRIGEDTAFDSLAEDKRNVIDVLDSYAKMRHLSALMEYRKGEGRLLICSLGLLEKTDHPEVRALLQGIYEYLGE